MCMEVVLSVLHQDKPLVLRAVWDGCYYFCSDGNTEGFIGLVHFYSAAKRPAVWYKRGQ